MDLNLVQFHGFQIYKNLTYVNFKSRLIINEFREDQGESFQEYGESLPYTPMPSSEILSSLCCLLCLVFHKQSTSHYDFSNIHQFTSSSLGLINSY